ncbi:hypothetical protein D3C86_1767370 [compost metagenome]
MLKGPDDLRIQDHDDAGKQEDLDCVGQGGVEGVGSDQGLTMKVLEEVAIQAVDSAECHGGAEEGERE